MNRKGVCQFVIKAAQCEIIQPQLPTKRWPLSQLQKAIWVVPQLNCGLVEL